jgi:carbon storage regulator
MLVLVRKTNEGFWIGNDIQILVLQAQAGRVKLGVQAPAGVRILRTELLGDEIDGGVSLET